MNVYKKSLNFIFTSSLFSAALIPQSVFCNEEAISKKEMRSRVKAGIHEMFNSSTSNELEEEEVIHEINNLQTSQGTIEEIYAEEVDIEEPVKAENKLTLNSRIQLGANYTRIYLKPHGYSSFKGNLGGLQALYEYRSKNSFYGGAAFVWKQGSAHGSAGKRSLLYFDAQERLGYTFSCEKYEALLTLFSGFAYRYLGQHLTPECGREVSFNYNEFYIPVGILADYARNPWVRFGVNFLWMPQVYPTVSIVPLKGARWVITHRLDNFLVEVPLTFTIKEDKSFIILKPSYQRWEDGHSTAKVPCGRSLGLPGNTYNFYGIDLNFSYYF